MSLTWQFLGLVVAIMLVLLAILPTLPCACR